MNKNKSRGLTLVELLVAMTIAAILMMGMAQVFSLSKSQYRLQTNLARLQENGRFAADFITREVRQAGYRADIWEAATFVFPLTANSSDGGSGSDVLELIQESDTDCFGVLNTNLDANGRPDFYIKISRFDTNEEDLRHTCSYGQAIDSVTQQISEVLISEVEEFQIQYGLDTNGDLSVNDWIAGGNWLADPTSVTLNQVISMRIGLLIATEDAVNNENDNQTFNLFGSVISAANDNKVRKQFVSTINMRNLTL